MSGNNPKTRLLARLSESQKQAFARVDSLLGLPDELHRLEPITRQLEIICNDLKAEIASTVINDIEIFCAVAREFLEGPDGQQYLKLFSPQETASNPFYGILLTHPFYPIFFYTCENIELKPAYQRLLQMMLKSRIIDFEKDPQSRFENLEKQDLQVLRTVCRLVRKLHKESEQTKVVLRQIDRFRSVGALVGWIRSGCVMNQPLEQAHYNELRQLGQFLADCHGLEQVTNIRVRRRVRAGSGRSHDRVNLALWDWRKHQIEAYASGQNEQWDTGMELRRLSPHVPKQSRQDLAEAGLLANEFHHDSEHWIGILHSDEGDLEAGDDDGDNGKASDAAGGKGEIETGLPSYAKYFTAAKNRAMKFAFDNQKTSTRWGRLTASENAELLKTIDEQFEEACRTAEDEQEYVSKRDEAARVRDLCLALAVMTVLGRVFDSVRELFVIESEAHWRQETMEIAFLRKEQRWLVSTPRLGYRKEPPQEQQRWYQPVTSRVLLPDRFSIGKWVCERADAEQTQQPLMGRHRTSQQKYFTEYFVDRRSEGGRFPWTIDSAASIFQDWLEVHESPTLAGLLVPRLAHHVSTQLFYTVVEASHLEVCYTRAWQALSDSLVGEGMPLVRREDAQLFDDHANDETAPHKANVAAYVGAERVAVYEYFQQVVGKLKDSLRGEFGELDLIARHNQFTAYTWFFLAFATASRGVHHPFEHLDQAVETGSIHLHDKDYEGAGQARVAFLPQSLTAHLEGYLSWCRGIIQVMARTAPATQVPFGQMVVESKRQTLQPVAGGQGYPLLGSLFFLDEQWHPLPATPKSVKEQLGAEHPLPINAQRHLLRSHLLREGCPEDIIDAFLGHWDRGREPWATYSVLDPQDFRDQLLTYLEPLLDKLGLEPLEPFR